MQRAKNMRGPDYIADCLKVIVVTAYHNVTGAAPVPDANIYMCPYRFVAFTGNRGEK